MNTYHIQLTRGQSFSFSRIARDPVTKQPRDLTDAEIFLAVRADRKSAVVIRITSQDPPPDDWRTGVVIADQLQYLGKYTVTFAPVDTASLVASGHDDPYIYDVRIQDSDGAVYQDIDESNLDLYPQVTDIPA